MIEKTGILLIVISVVLAAFTANILISRQETKLAASYDACLNNGDTPSPEMKHAHVNLLISCVCRWGVAIGIATLIVNYFVT